MSSAKALKNRTFLSRDLFLSKFEILATTDYEYLKISIFTALDMKFWMKEDNDLHTDHL